MSGEASSVDGDFTSVADILPKEGLGQYAVRPVTIRQVLSATQAHSQARFKIEGIEVVNVAIVAHLVDMDTDHHRSNVFHLEDLGRGWRITARQWDDDIPGTDEDPHGVDDITVHSHVKVVGIIKEYNGKKSIAVKHIRRIPAGSLEAYHHLLQSVYITLQYRKGPPPPQILESHDDSLGKTQASDNMSAEYSTSLADERTHGSQSSSPPASQAVPRPTYSPGDDRARFPALGERISEADWHPGMPADDRFVVGRSSERIRETISQASVPEEPNGSDSVDEEALQRTQEDSNSRLASLSLWDDNEPFTSTPAPAPPSDATAHGSQTNIPKQPPETYHSYSQDRVLSPDPYAYLPSLHRAIMLQMHENDADNDFDDDYIGIDERRIIRVVKFKDPGITTQEIQDALDLLLEEGHIYCTVDDSHFRLTK